MEALLRGWFFGRREGVFTAGMAPYPPLGGAKAGIGIRVSKCESVVFCGGRRPHEIPPTRIQKLLFQCLPLHLPAGDKEPSQR